ncbi:2'-5' RNA ligase family protein [Halorussus halobius]|uniref:2'-5' RNA ligase family protein n=1 Tax=Halorussus halobius TaxID=1710537 RepID=UPI001092F9FB|nr:2'-5' RNA ligase family protein [Halorussus halobius]
MYSLNVPVPGEVSRLAEELRPALLAFERIRERHSLVCKRLGDDGTGGRGRSDANWGTSRDERRRDVPRLRERVREALAGAPAFEARVAGIDYFPNPPLGEGPVAYLAVESPGLRRVHRRLLPEFSAVEAFEGDDYVPHVTLARGGDVADARRLADREVEPVTWTVDRLDVWDAKYEESVATFPLPA